MPQIHKKGSIAVQGCKSPPRILHIAPGEYGGGDSVVFSLVDMAREHGLQADVLVDNEEMRQICTERGIGIFCFEGIVRPIRPVRDLSAAIRLKRIIRGRYEVLHTHGSKGGAVGRLAARWARIPAVIHTVHGFAFHEHSSRLKTSVIAAAERIMARWCDKLIVVNTFDRQRALELGIGSKEKLVTVYNGVPESRLDSGRGINRRELLDELKIPNNSFLCVFVGRLAPQKGLNHLIEAMAMVRDRMSSPAVHLALIGEGELRAEINEQVQKLNLSDRVHLLGFQSACLRWTGGCDLFVLSSLWEGHSITLLEAMGLGRPIVATDIKGNRETITSGEDGLLVPAADPAALAEAVMELAANNQRASEFGQRARKTFEERFTEQVMKDESWQVYQALLAAKGLLEVNAEHYE